jgi:hypothetical protein
MPKHERKGLMFRFEKAPGQWGDWIVVPTGGGGGRDDKLTDLQAQLVQVGNLIKQQGSNAGKVIGTNGATLEWVTASGGGGVTSVTGLSPVVSSGGATPQISLASGYGDTLNPYATKTANHFLSAPNGSSGVPSFRAIVAADIPTLNQNTTGTAANVTGTVAAANGGTGIASYAVGDLLYASASTTLAKLGIGAPGEILQAGATTPEWGMLSGNTTTIQLRNSSTPGSVPTALSLSAGEVVVNTADGKLYFKDSGGTVQVLAQSGTVPISNGGTGQTTQGAAFDALAPTTSKGDLIVHNGTTDIRLAVGTDNHVLTADSSVAAGVKWAAAGGGGGGISSADIQEFTSTGTSTWTKPAGAKMVYVLMFGGGGGGGSGRKRSSGNLASAASAGGSGGAGGRTELWIPASALGSTVTVTVGAGGTGGAAQTNNDTSGNAGLIGNNSSFGSFGLARGGTEGFGGLTTSGGAGFGGGSLGEFSNGSSSYTANGATGGTGTGNDGPRGGYRPGGGGTGGGFSASSTTLRAGGAGGLGGSLLDSSTTSSGGGGAGGNTSGAPNGSAGANASSYFVGGSGGGGGASGSTTAGNGGTGGYPGGGGGSGGAGYTVNSGAGGNGGNGYVRVVTFF